MEKLKQFNTHNVFRNKYKYIIMFVIISLTKIWVLEWSQKVYWVNKINQEEKINIKNSKKIFDIINNKQPITKNIEFEFYDEIKSFELYTYNWKLLFKKEFFQEFKKEKLNISNIINGVYYIKIIDLEEGVHLAKFIYNKDTSNSDLEINIFFKNE